MKWAIQVTLISSGDSNGLYDAITGQGMECLPIYMVPFQEEMPEIDGLQIDDDVIFYGSTKLTKLACETAYKPGVWFDHDKFLYSHHIDLNGELMLNHDARITTLRNAAQIADDFLGNEAAVGNPFFCRPLGDLKQFSGEIIQSTHDLYTWQEKLKMAGMWDYLDTDVMIASAKQIRDEHRCFVVDGQIASSAKYINSGKRVDSETTPSELVEISEFVKDVAMPMDVVVCDVAWTDKGWKVIEFNCLNASGFYGHDKPAIVEAVSGYSWNTE